MHLKEHLAASFASAAKHDLVKGFAVGRTIFGDTWLAHGLPDDISDDEHAVEQMSENYAAICELWDNTRNTKGEARMKTIRLTAAQALVRYSKRTVE